ncbi:hypothetical protein DET61_11922 [Marinobacter nauticus]|uniref:Uncharacterized protein n=1 Tax=Marinobacter nauticus TaxID=2743 RepID=A0A368X607_MARNT|nr:hypothetical protein DET61_11922 [Marinobacter nauticus]
MRDLEKKINRLQKVLMNAGIFVLICVVLAGLVDYFVFNEKALPIIRVGAGLGLAMTIGSVALVILESVCNRFISRKSKR